MLQYSTTILRTLCSTISGSYSGNFLTSIVKSRAIELGIKRQPRYLPFRRSRAGIRLVRRIASIASNRGSHIGASNQTGVCDGNLIRIISNHHSETVQNRLRISHINTRSVSKKANDLQAEIMDNDIDICVLTETWIKPEDDWTCKEVTPPGYHYFNHPRLDGRKGGGTALLYKSQLRVLDYNDKNNLETMEYSSYQLRLGNRNLNLLVIYRLPTSSVINFGHELTTLIETNILNNRGDPLLIGDFNIHTDIPEDSDTINFNDLLDGLNLKNYIDFPTHRSHHTLDLILTDADSNLIHSVEQGFMLSDHYFIHCLLQQSKSRPTTEIVRYRKLKKIDKSKFATDVLQHFRLAETPNNLSDMLDHYNKTLTDLLETHAPVKEKSIKRTHNQPWFNDNIKCEIALHVGKRKSPI